MELDIRIIFSWFDQFAKLAHTHYFYTVRSEKYEQVIIVKHIPVLLSVEFQITMTISFMFIIAVPTFFQYDITDLHLKILVESVMRDPVAFWFFCGNF